MTGDMRRFKIDRLVVYVCIVGVLSSSVGILLWRERDSFQGNDYTVESSGDFGLTFTSGLPGTAISFTTEGLVDQVNS